MLLVLLCYDPLTRVTSNWCTLSGLWFTAPQFRQIKIRISTIFSFSATIGLIGYNKTFAVILLFDRELPVLFSFYKEFKWIADIRWQNSFYIRSKSNQTLMKNVNVRSNCYPSRIV